ncbi:hypothetical protein Ade02nite_00370 [Paractinoplanes deccanensis]|uniref:Uncharacterized protein n=1 Tax=Paractinoplanes deccanensis TaxID=113561 RepID=A0ABQ3XUH9_9ACTN|nr:hypothetical protein [Actinoplanes deccanensis]GID71396.1 hypothetical protein Ade02nite_00370 [Actinoplanes deccanensis]
MKRIALVAAVVAAALLGASPASAHGFTSNVYADVTSGADGHVRTKLGLEYDLLIVSAADMEKDDPLFRAGTAAFDDGDGKAQAAALESHAATVLSYVTKRYTVTAGGAACKAVRQGGFTIGEREGVPYADVVLDWTCASGDGHEVRSALFPDGEGYVRATKTLTTYALDGRSGSVTLDAANPALSTAPSWPVVPVVIGVAAALVIALALVLVLRNRRSKA